MIVLIILINIFLYQDYRSLYYLLIDEYFILADNGHHGIAC